MKNLDFRKFQLGVASALLLAASSASAAVCTIQKGQQICASSAASLARVTGMSNSQAQVAQNNYNAQVAAANAKAAAEAAKRAADYAAAQKAAAALEAQKAKEAAALKAAQQKQKDQLAIGAPPKPSILPAVCSPRTPCGPFAIKDNSKAAAEAAKLEAQRAAAAKAAAELQAKQLEAQRQLAERQKLQTQVAKQVTSSGSTCNGYMQSGRCVLNGQVAFNGGSPVNVMNQPKSTWSSGGTRQTCTLVYTYKAGRVVGSPQSVCTFS